MASKNHYQSEYLVKVLVLEEEEAGRDDGVASVEVDMDQEKMVDWKGRMENKSTKYCTC